MYVTRWCIHTDYQYARLYLINLLTPIFPDTMQGREYPSEYVYTANKLKELDTLL
jgi:hypothetical protein